jgi:hypothetical protein
MILQYETTNKKTILPSILILTTLATTLCKEIKLLTSLFQEFRLQFVRKEAKQIGTGCPTNIFPPSLLFCYLM